VGLHHPLLTTKPTTCRSNETFFCCAYGGHSATPNFPITSPFPTHETHKGPQLLAIAGSSRLVKIIDPTTVSHTIQNKLKPIETKPHQTMHFSNTADTNNSFFTQTRLVLTLSGHGDDIYDCQFHPVDEWLLITASKDQSLRLWNVMTGTPIFIFAGHEGHRESVLTLDIDSLGGRMVSGGMDTEIKLWSLATGHHKASVAKSYELKGCGWLEIGSTERVFPTLYEQMPYFSTTRVHTDYVDCVRFVGSDLIASKVGYGHKLFFISCNSTTQFCRAQGTALLSGALLSTARRRSGCSRTAGNKPLRLIPKQGLGKKPPATSTNSIAVIKLSLSESLF